MKTAGRNEPCPCNSGRKYKHCCYAKDRARSTQGRAEAAAAREALLQAVQLQRAGRLNEAEARYQQALQIGPDLPKADLAGVHYNLGNVLQQQDRREDAVASYRRALELQPQSVEISGNLGNALHSLGRLEEAAAVYRGALAFRPGDALVHFNLGNVLSEQGAVDDALGSYRKALSLRPDFDDALNNLELGLRRQGRLAELETLFREQIVRSPARAHFHAVLGQTLVEQGRFDEALASYRATLSLAPADPKYYENLLFLCAVQGMLEPAQYLALARGWEQAVVPAQAREQAARRRFRRPAPEGRRLRVGYVSGDFRHHAISYFIEQLFGHHDRARIELHAYATADVRDEVTARLEGLVDHWTPVARLSDAELRDRIDADGIDVLVDLSGHTAHNRLGAFALRAAPVQAHYLGYFASTGLTEMDYWIGDEVLTPPASDAHFCERVWRLPRAWVSYKTVANAPESDWRPASDGSVWLGSCNNLRKLNPQTLSLWCRVLQALPEGRLRLKSKELADAGNRRRILDAMSSGGISADRIDLQGESDWTGYMAQYGSVDIALDPVVGHGGGTTTCDALWMGVPVVHALGRSTGSRFSASLLSAVGHPEWIAQDEEAYVEKVVALARDVDLRRQIRANLRQQMAQSPLCDARGLAKSLEEAYFAMYGRWLERQAG